MRIDESCAGWLNLEACQISLQADGSDGKKTYFSCRRHQNHAQRDGSEGSLDIKNLFQTKHVDVCLADVDREHPQHRRRRLLRRAETNRAFGGSMHREIDPSASRARHPMHRHSGIRHHAWRSSASESSSKPVEAISTHASKFGSTSNCTTHPFFPYSYHDAKSRSAAGIACL